LKGSLAPELPPEKERAYKKAMRLEWATIIFFTSAVTLIYLTLGSSQAMKAAWIEDLLAFVPPIAFLIAGRTRYRRPDEDYPYGYHRAVGIAYLAAALALMVLGVVILFDSVMKLIRFEHPPIGLVQPFGDPIWLGWLMIGALTYTMVPAVILGRLKIPPARELHDKVLFADAEMNKADWMTAGAAILGVLGIRFGLWWADGVAATVISLSIVSDGLKNVRAATGSLMDKRPHLVDDSAIDPLPARMASEVTALRWVADARVRVREEGHVFFGEVLIVPSDHANLVRRIEDTKHMLLGLDWRLYDVTVSVSERLEWAEEEEAEQERLQP
jgi:cation diffusion facilitator family transporter